MKLRVSVSSVLLLTMALGVGAWLAEHPIHRSAASDPDTVRRFGDVYQLLRDGYVDSIPDAELYVRAARGLVAKLHDPYASLLIGAEYDKLRERTSGDYAGVGLQVEARNGELVVVAPVPDSPAERAGIRTGDVIVAIAGRDATRWTVAQSREALRGLTGTAVDVSIRREDAGDPVVYRLVRSKVHQSAVRSEVLFPDGVGYLRWVTVSEHSADELREAVAGLVARGMRTLLLDLRSNPGGLRDEAVRAADLFLNPGQSILVTRGRAPGDNLRLHDTAAQRWPTLPIVLLVNGGTASASEILAGALQDHDRGVVLGLPTYGKGLVQTVFPLGERVALRLTTARWFTPSGRSIQRPMTDSLGPAGAVDTARIYRTDAGRRLVGGGGIQPDLTVDPDTLTDVEQKLGKFFAASLDGFRDALTGYAVDVRRQRLVASEDFTVTQAMRTALLRRLRRGGVAVSDSLYAAGTRLVDRELGYEITRYNFGRAAESRRRAEEDSQVSVARALIAAGRTREALSPATADR